MKTLIIIGSVLVYMMFCAAYVRLVVAGKKEDELRMRLLAEQEAKNG